MPGANSVEIASRSCPAAPSYYQTVPLLLNPRLPSIDSLLLDLLLCASIASCLLLLCQKGASTGPFTRLRCLFAGVLSRLIQFELARDTCFLCLAISHVRSRFTGPSAPCSLAYGYILTHSPVCVRRFDRGSLCLHHPTSRRPILAAHHIVIVHCNTTSSLLCLSLLLLPISVPLSSWSGYLRRRYPERLGAYLGEA